MGNITGVSHRPGFGDWNHKEYPGLDKPGVVSGWWIDTYESFDQYAKQFPTKPYFLPAPGPEGLPIPEQPKQDPGSPFKNNQIDLDPDKGINWPGKDVGKPPPRIDPNTEGVPARFVDNSLPPGYEIPDFSVPDSQVPSLRPGEQQAQFDYGNGNSGFYDPGDVWSPPLMETPNPFDTPKSPPFNPYDPTQYTPEQGNQRQTSPYLPIDPSAPGPVYGPEFNPNLNSQWYSLYQLPPGAIYNPGQAF